MPAPAIAIHDLVQEEGEVRFTVTGTRDELEVRFWGDVPSGAAPPVEVALASALLPAMAVGGTLSLPAPVDPQLRRMLPDIQAVLKSIAAQNDTTGGSLQTADVSAPQSETGSASGRPPAEATGVGAFFSGGVDSWSAVLSDPDVTDLIYVHGFDIPLKRPESSAAVERRLAESASAQGRRLRVVRTNLRTLLDPHAPWEVAHGPALTATALLFAPSLRRVLIGGTATYAEPAPRGSHPLHDHLWSIERCRIEHCGAHLTRTAKIEQLAEHQEALDVLRVCWQQFDRYNCGRCEKCIRTMVALDAIGALGRCPTFGAALDLDAVAHLHFHDSELPIWWRENLELARAREADPRLVSAIEACLAANEPAADGEMAELSEELVAARLREEALARDLHSVVSSRSWRITAPLRRAGAAARRLRRRRPD